jgi:hypothetical protein
MLLEIPDRTKIEELNRCADTLVCARLLSVAHDPSRLSETNYVQKGLRSLPCGEEKSKLKLKQGY